MIGAYNAMKPGRNGILPQKGSVIDAQPVCTPSCLFHGSLYGILSDRIPLARGERHHPRHLGALSAGRCHPLQKYAIVPYFARFAWIPFTLFYLLLRGDRSDFWRVCLCLFAGMTIALSCYVLLPTGLALRPYRVYGSDIFARLVRMLYAVDSSKNVCPSIHVFNSVTLMIGYRRSRCFDEPRRRWMRPASAVLCVSIIASTVLLKQHSCIDVLLGILLGAALAFALDAAATTLERSGEMHRIPQRL